MKAEIDAGGLLIISSENDLEAYALRRWQEEFQPNGINMLDRIILDHSFPPKVKYNASNEKR